MKNIFLSLIAMIFAAVGPAAPAADWSIAGGIPVFHSGRPKPLQTFAREAVDAIYDRSSKVRLDLEGYFDVRDQAQWEKLKDQYGGNEWKYLVAEELANDSNYAGLLELFPEGKPRTFEPTEIVLSWLIEPDKWERVPFIYAPHEDLRKVLGVKVETGRLKYVSPREVYQSDSLRDYLLDLRDRQEAGRSSAEGFQPTSVDRLVQELLERYNAWRRLTLDPRDPLAWSPVEGPGTRGRFVSQIIGAFGLANETNTSGQSFESLLRFVASGNASNSDDPLVRNVVEALSNLDELRAIGQRLAQQHDGSLGGADAAGVTLEEAEQRVIAFRGATRRLADSLRQYKDRSYQKSGGLSAAQLQNIQKILRELASKAEGIHGTSLEMHVALYDGSPYHEGDRRFFNHATVLVAPALNPYALAKHRDTKNTSQPWLSLQAVLYADKLLADYPPAAVAKVRQAWSDLAAAFPRRSEANYDEQVRTAQAQLAAALRELGEGVDPVRRKLIAEALPPGEQDEVLLAYTAYPPQWRIDTETRYYNIDPFKWSWVLSALALVCFAVAFGAARRPMFWTGVAILGVCAVWTAYGFALRILVTGWAPVTNMYETVVYVPWVMLVLGLWFLLIPLTWTGMKQAWLATGLPHTWETFDPAGQARWTALNWAVQPFRFALMAATFYFLSVMPLGHGGRPYFPLLPNLSDVAGFGGVANTLGVWLVGVTCLLLTVWFGPRLLLASVLSLYFVPASWRRRGALARMAKDVYPRQTFAAAAAGGACFFFLLAWWAPVLDESFQPLQPVLRSNFWLTIHVLTIVASYGAGMLAWGLGAIALFYLTFGKYRDPAVPAHLPEGLKPADHSDDHKAAPRRPPEEVGVLANYAYRAIQVAVLLLAAGTILGGLWADVSWGRFWGWDPKEVWALISLLVYLAILHGRFAGWFNHFGLIFGTVFGATMIAMSWYGVNFVLPTIAKGGAVGLHSYGEGAGGQGYVFAFVGLNWLFLGAATVRYLTETSIARKPVDDTETPIPAVLSREE